MSGNFTIKIEGLDNLKKQLSSDSTLSRILPDINAAILKYHTALEKRIADNYTIRRKLSPLLQFKATTNAQKFLTYELSYKYVAVPLNKYKYEVEDSGQYNLAPRLLNGKFIRVKSPQGAVVMSEVVKGKPKKAYRYTGSPLQVWENPNTKNLYSRLQHYTWKGYNFPDIALGTHGQRDKYAVAYGPSMSQLAESIYSYDTVFHKQNDILTDDILKAFLRYYD